MNRTHGYPMVQALLAALLFGASAPVAKILLGRIEPIPLAAFLYLGSGVGLMVFRVIRSMTGLPVSREARMRTADAPWVVGAILSGGVAAPVLLMFSLRSTPASEASLLLNFEGVATTWIAALIFKEAIGGRVWGGVACITVASLLISMDVQGDWEIALGGLGVLGACVLWGLDNNLTRNISAKDPLSIVMIKGLGAGAFSLLLALALGNPFPSLRIVLGGMALGIFSYGVSIMLFILAMRELGAARTSALFGTAPFAGTLISFMLLREVPDASMVVSLPIMVIGAALLLGERHAHTHAHPMVQHDHRHDHEDEHHTHGHREAEISADNSHAHPHSHEATNHSHQHKPDIHHRHGHGKPDRK